LQTFYDRFKREVAEVSFLEVALLAAPPARLGGCGDAALAWMGGGEWGLKLAQLTVTPVPR
jgi:hypothetical protein